MVASLYAILKAGGAYIPLDPAYPPERLERMLVRSRTEVVIGNATTPKRLIEKVETFLDTDEALSKTTDSADFPTSVSLSPDHLAYVIYTSGSTGNPKGVEISHSAICNLLRSMQRYPGFSAENSMLATSSISFDLSVTEIFLPLCSGGTLILVSEDLTREGVGLSEFIGEMQPDYMQATPTQLELLLLADWQGEKNLSVITGGEEVPAKLATELKPKLKNLYIGYGPTEATVWVSIRRIEDKEDPILIGGIVDHVQFEVVDDSNHKVDEGEAGELLISGKQLSRGYRFEPELTQNAFVKDLQFGDSKTLYYRSGDLVRKHPSGLLEFLGRIDHQVKVRGYRIELGEIEAALSHHPSLEKAVALAIDDRGTKTLIAGCEFIDRAPKLSELRAYLSETLPNYMIPSRFVLMEKFPLTPNNKTDRKAIAEAAFSKPTKPIVIATEGSIEYTIQSWMNELLHTEGMGLHSNFLAEGGNSLSAGQLIARIRQEYDLALSWKTVFESPTPAGLAEHIRKNESTSPGYPIPILGSKQRTQFPLSSGQQSLWFLEQIYPGNMAYTFQSLLYLKGKLDIPALNRSLTKLLERHHALRTSFEEHEGEVIQVVQPPKSIVTPLHDLTEFPKEERESRAIDLIDKEVDKGFDLASGEPVRWALYRTDQYNHILLHHEHHLIHDGWSFRVFVSELFTLYSSFRRDQSIELKEMPAQFGDFSQAEQLWLKSEEAAEQLEY